MFFRQAPVVIEVPAGADDFDKRYARQVARMVQREIPGYQLGFLIVLLET